MRIVAGILMIFSLTGFSFIREGKKPKRLKRDEYMCWVESASSGLRSTSLHNEFDFVAVFQPMDYMILKGEKDVNKITKNFLETQREELKNLQYYSFFITLNNGKKNVVKYLTDKLKISPDEMVRYLAFDMQHDIKLVQGVDTLHCNFLHFDETYELTPYSHFLVAFENQDSKKSQPDEERTLTIHLPWLEEKMVKLSFKECDINTVPKLIVKH